jgi:hypothetical protein
MRAEAPLAQHEDIQTENVKTGSAHRCWAWWVSKPAFARKRERAKARIPIQSGDRRTRRRTALLPHSGSRFRSFALSCENVRACFRVERDERLRALPENAKGKARRGISIQRSVRQMAREFPPLPQAHAGADPGTGVRTSGCLPRPVRGGLVLGDISDAAFRGLPGSFRAVLGRPSGT